MCVGPEIALRYVCAMFLRNPREKPAGTGHRPARGRITSRRDKPDDKLAGTIAQCLDSQAVSLAHQWIHNQQCWPHVSRGGSEPASNAGFSIAHLPLYSQAALALETASQEVGGSSRLLLDPFLPAEGGQAISSIWAARSCRR